MIEGNEFYEQTGVGGDDGRALILDRVDGVTVTCNRMHDNDGGLVLRGASRAVTVGYNEFQAQTAGAAIEVAAGAAEQLSITRNLIHGNLDGIRYDGATPLAVPENWFGANDGPAPIGSGDPLVGALDGAGFIAHGTAPLLVRRPEASGWSFPQAACRDRLQEAIDAAPDGSIVLAGAGEYYEHLTITRPLRLWGETGASGCSRAVVHGYQDPQAVRPVIAVTSTDHVTLTDLTVRSAAQGLPCGSTDPQQVGIALTDVSDSTLQRLCLIENGVSELRLFGASHRNRLLDLSIDGMTRDQFGQDVCGHRSREAISIVGDPVCSGGDGAVPTGNRIERLSAQRVAQGVALELAAGTTIEASTIDAEPAAAWGGGSLAIGVRAAPAAETSITTSQIGSPLTREAIQLAGRSAVQCAAEQTDTTQTTIAGNTLRGSVAAIHLAHASGDPGAVVEVAISCNRMLGAGDGVASDESERATPGVALHHNDLNGTSAGVRNLGAASIDATANWWGAADGPSGAGAGSGDPVQGAVEFSGFLAAAAAIDADGDGLSLCAGDCGPLDALVFPGATESCDGLDNDCNAAIDDPPAPGPVLDLQLARLAGGAARITWSTTPSATRYDVIAGRLSALLATAGDFAPATERCITATEGTGAIDGGGNSSGGTWYLVRGANCGGNGSYDQTTPDQTQSRDASIAASPIACP
jgi:hypothetical protein